MGFGQNCTKAGNRINSLSFFITGSLTVEIVERKVFKKSLKYMKAGISLSFCKKKKKLLLTGAH